MSEAVCTNLPENCSYAREGRRFRAVGGHTVCPECGSPAMVLSQSRIKLPVDVPGLTAPKRTRRVEPPPLEPPGRGVKATVTTPTPAEAATTAAAAPAPPLEPSPRPSLAAADAPSTAAAVTPPVSAETAAVGASPPRKPPPEPRRTGPVADGEPRRRPNALQISALVLLACIGLLWLTMHRRLQSPEPVKPDVSSTAQNGLTVESAPEVRPAPVAEPPAAATDNTATGENSVEPAPTAPRTNLDTRPGAQPAPEASAAPETAPSARHAPVVRGPTWERRPTAEEIAQFYPEAASEAGQGGRVTLRCRVTREGALVDCEIAAEDPPGLGFGEAALRMTRLFRMSPKTIDGQAIDGAPISVPIAFEPDH